MLSLAGRRRQSHRCGAAPPSRAARRLQRDLTGRADSLRLQFEQVLSELRINQSATPAGRVAAERRHSRTAWAILAHARGCRRRRGSQRARPGPQVMPSPTAGQPGGRPRGHETHPRQHDKWEGFQEAVGLLREVSEDAGPSQPETEQRIASEVLGNRAERAAEPDEEARSLCMIALDRCVGRGCWASRPVRRRRAGSPLAGALRLRAGRGTRWRQAADRPRPHDSAGRPHVLGWPRSCRQDRAGAGPAAAGGAAAGPRTAYPPEHGGDRWTA